MSTIDNKFFSPSVNIIRDIDREINYVPTSNAKRIYNSLINNSSKGIKSFNIVGAYGTGKSSFLWALEKNLNSKTQYFAPLNGHFKDISSFEFRLIQGDYTSILNSFADEFKVKSDYTSKEIINSIDKYYKRLNREGKGLVLIVDEFGKFLEYASKNNPEKELFFIQQLSEYVNDTDKNIFFITTLHQDFSAYSFSLSNTQQQEWDKVKGRLKELTFNEPVEQLLFLASERLKGVIDIKNNIKKNESKLFNAIRDSKIFPLKDYFNKDIADKINPLELLSASILTIALQKYGQNERSLFSFIEANDEFGLTDYKKKSNPFYNIACVYDYLLNNFYSFLSTKFNPDYSAWVNIKSSIERVDDEFDDGIDDAHKIIKTIGLSNLLGRASSKIDKDFLLNYSKYSLGIKNAEKIIDKLVTKKIIRFVNFKSSYILFEGTDIDIEYEIEEAGNYIERPENIVKYLNEYFDFPFVLAKSTYYEKGTPRSFEFKLTENPISNIKPEGQIDGFINLVFSNSLKEKELRKHSTNCNEAVLYCLYKNTEEIKDIVFEIEKIKRVKIENNTDKVAFKELNAIQKHYTRLLNQSVLGNLYSNNDSLIWFFNGERKVIENQKTFNRLLSEISNTIYFDTPIFRNELINKTKVSVVVSGARNNLMNRIVNNWNKENLGFENNKFPPEKTIYLSLLRETGIHTEIDGAYILQRPNEGSTFHSLWRAGEGFLNKSRVNKINLSEFVDVLKSKPLKLKQGLIDFWLPIFLFIKREDFALYDSNTYIPNLSEETLELVIKNPNKFQLKAFDLSEDRLALFNNYRTILNQIEEDKLSSKSFIETIRPFLVFHKGLTTYTKNTSNISIKARALRDVILNSKEPEKTFFEDFPKAMGFNTEQLGNSNELLEEFAIVLQESIRELSSAYDQLINRVEAFLLNDILGEQLIFPDYKNKLQKRYKTLKRHMLKTNQKVFYQRIYTPLDDRKSWINSIAQSSLGKSLESISDKDEKVLYERLNKSFHELDNLCEIANSDIDFEKEEVFKLELTSFVKGIENRLVRIPKSKLKKMSTFEKSIKGELSGDKELNIALLVKLLQEELKDE